MAAGNTKLTTAADTAAALTYLKSNYEFPKTFQDGSGPDAIVYRLVPVMNYSTGRIRLTVMKVLSGPVEQEYVGEATIDVLAMAQMSSDQQRMEYVCKVVAAVIVESKKIAVYKQAQQQQAQNSFISALSGALGGVGGAAGALGGIAGTELSQAAVEVQKALQSSIKLVPCMLCGKQHEVLHGKSSLCQHCHFEQKQEKLEAMKWKQQIAEMKKQQTAQEEAQKAKDVFFTKQFLANLKAQTAFSKANPSQISAPSDDDFKDTISDEQKFIQRVGVMSNCNVSIQGKRMALGSTIYRMKCDKCAEARPVEPSVVRTNNASDPALVAFCTAHRHIVESPSAKTEGRRFREI